MRKLTKEEITGYWGCCEKCDALFPIPMDQAGNKGFICEEHKNEDLIRKGIEKCIEDEQKEYARSKFFESKMMQEYADPIEFGKVEALEKLGTWQEHIRKVEGRIQAYKDYLKNV